MLSKSPGMMVIVSSPSGAGKTTLVRLLAERNGDFVISISYTTRIPRKNEIHGRDYYFLSNKEFNNIIKKKLFYEYARVFNNYYGTLKTPVIKNLSLGKDVLFDIDWQGSEQIKKQKIDNKLISIFILPPSIQILKERLYKRDMRDKTIVKERMSQFKNDVKHWVDYDYVAINHNLEDCYKEITQVINLEKKGNSFLFDKEKIKKKVIELTS